MAKGYFSLVLHAHLPFVRHPGPKEYLEERWLFEAMTETYIPLLQVYQGLIRDGVDFRATMSFTPTLLSMLSDEFLQSRYLEHLRKLIDLASEETKRTQNDARFHRLAVMYLEKFRHALDFYVGCQGNIIQVFRKIQELGYLEIVTSAATHAFFPLVKTKEAVRAQIATALQVHEQHFGRKPQGIWLPECGFAPGVDGILREFGIQYFFVDSHGLGTAQPTPVFGTLSPVVTESGIAVFARDEDSSRQVWSSREGYPGDFDYREYYRDIGFDLDFDTVKPYIHADGIRVNTGIKYYRITGNTPDKEPYDVDRAREKAAQHAGNFMFNREKQVEYWAAQMGREPIVVSPYDAELFGHWWYEGPVFLDMLFRKLHFDQDTVKPITPSEYLARYPDYQVCRLGMSSWGRGGYADVWLREENDWIYPALHIAEQRMVELANSFVSCTQLELRALNQAARELMLAQSSDFAFIMDNKTMVDYAVKRTKQHVNRFMRLYHMMKTGSVIDSYVEHLESIDNLFPDVDYKVYQSVELFQLSPAHAVSSHTSAQGTQLRGIARRTHKPAVLMLSWEFPPMTVGGLSRHVYDLSRHLARLGFEVHVVTVQAGGAPYEEIADEVHVHRVPVLQPDGGEFVHWVLQLNLMMIDSCRQLVEQGVVFDVVHAHDWLVYYAGKTLKQAYGLPLVATVHATEHGRNGGISTDLQRFIHGLEWKLTYEARHVITCSSYMLEEVKTLFSLPVDKLSVIANGVDPTMLQTAMPREGDRGSYANSDEFLVLFIGRLVREKGVQTLIDAAPDILTAFPNTRFVVAGKGPLSADLQRQAASLGVSGNFRFTGFISDEERNRLLQFADVAVFPSLYEPFGIVALEAMVAGTPVVAADVGGLRDVVIHEHNGLRMYSGDSASLALQVQQLLACPDLSARLAQQARSDAAKYDWNEIAKLTGQIYRRVLVEQEQNHGILQIAAGERDQ